MQTTDSKQPKQDASPPQRDGRGRFVNGNKGGGRKKEADRMKTILQGASEEAIKLMIETMRDPEAKINLRIDCAQEILTRVYGKASQPLSENGGDGAIAIFLAPELSEYGE